MFSKEVYLGTSAKDFSEIKVILDNNKIPYKTKVTSLDGSESSFFSSFGSSSRRSMGNANTNSNYLREYRILVKKEFYEQAIFVINNSIRSKS